MPGYDPACEALARHFLGGLSSDRLTRELAQEIQNTVESWMEREISSRLKAAFGDGDAPRS